jgi:hypothetical protein
MGAVLSIHRKSLTPANLPTVHEAVHGDAGGRPFFSTNAGRDAAGWGDARIT